MTDIPASESTSPKVPDKLLQDVERLTEENRRWRGRSYASWAAFGFLLIVSLIQFSGTFMTARLLHEAQVDSQRIHAEALDVLNGANAQKGEAAERILAAGEWIDEVQRARSQVRQESKAVRHILSQDVELRKQVLELLRRRQGENPSAEELEQLTAPMKDDLHEKEIKRPLVCPVPPLAPANK